MTSSQKKAATATTAATVGRYAPRCRWKPGPDGFTGGGAADCVGVGVGLGTVLAVIGTPNVAWSGSSLTTFRAACFSPSWAVLKCTVSWIACPGCSFKRNFFGMPVSEKKVTSVAPGDAAGVEELGAGVAVVFGEAGLVA